MKKHRNARLRNVQKESAGVPLLLISVSQFLWKIARNAKVGLNAKLQSAGVVFAPTDHMSILWPVVKSASAKYAQMPWNVLLVVALTEDVFLTPKTTTIAALVATDLVSHY